MLPVTSRVPQDSKLGPLFCLIFINDLPEIVFNSRVFLSADDLKLLYNENVGNAHGIKQNLVSILRGIYKTISASIYRIVPVHKL